MRALLTALAFCLASLPNAAASGKVYLLSGNIINIQSPDFWAASAQLEKQIKDKHPSWSYENRHNSEWHQICDEIGHGDFYPVILIGHSYGGQAEADISRCLSYYFNGKPVNLIIAIDIIQKLLHGPGNVFPENAKVIHSFYQNQDLLLRGYQDVQREDGTTRGITNTHVEVHSPLSPHYALMLDLMISGTILELIP